MARCRGIHIDVRFESKDDMCAAKPRVCFTLESGHVQCTRVSARDQRPYGRPTEQCDKLAPSHLLPPKAWDRPS
jgi:hypothetical protein